MIRKCSAFFSFCTRVCVCVCVCVGGGGGGASLIKRSSSSKSQTPERSLCTDMQTSSSGAVLLPPRRRAGARCGDTCAGCRAAAWRRLSRESNRR